MKALLYFFYEILIWLVFILYFPVILYKMIVYDKYKQGFKQRFGFLSQAVKKCCQDDPVIWFHAVSVGETAAASSIVDKVAKYYPEHKIIFSTITDTGQNMAHQEIDQADEIIYFPLDFALVVKKVLAIVNPEVVVIMETELWPNFLRLAKKQGSQIILANGRISDDSYKLYNYVGPITKKVLANIDIFSMQSASDVERIIDLGAKKERVYNSGNTKFDRDYVSDDKEAIDFKEKFKLDNKAPIFVAGSTHPNEEEQLLDVYQQLQEEFPELVMILAPRHIRRSQEIKKIYQQAGVDVCLRTEIESRDDEAVILLDTIGELAQVYGIGDVIFVGGSLIELGGHNILEPVAHGKLVFFGPNMSNFRDNVELVLRHDVGIQVEDKNELAIKLSHYLNNQDKLEAKGRQAIEMIKQNQGAAKRNRKLIGELING